MTKGAILDAKYHAGELYNSLQVAYWVEGAANAEYHTKSAQKSFAKLAEYMGYTIAPIAAQEPEASP